MSQSKRKAVIEAQGLTKSYDEVTVFQDLTFTVHEGDFVYLIGKSGAGKSVLGRCLAALEPVDSGSVRLFGVELTTLSERELLPRRRQCVYVFQNPCLFDSKTALENIEIPLRFTGHPARTGTSPRELLELAGLADVGGQYPAQLSQGARKRISVVRALALGPRCLILDEPTTGFNREEGMKLMDLVLSLKQRLGFTLVVVSHHREVILARWERIFYLHPGGLTQVDEKQQLQLDLQGNGFTIVREFLGAAL